MTLPWASGSKGGGPEMTPVWPYFEASALGFKLLYDKRGLGFRV